MQRRSHSVPLTDPQGQKWDIIIVGTGMGGSVLGHALARAGKKVLFCEQGLGMGNFNINKGRYAETTFAPSTLSKSQRSNILRHSARNSEAVEDISYRHPRHFVPFIGVGSGGSTGLFGMALERLFPCDFFPKDNFRHAPNANLPESWPITYEDLQPYYALAEKLFRVRGTTDPLRKEPDLTTYLEPPSLSEEGQELYRVLDGKGLHPYRLPLACEYVSDCECCQGFLCAKNCKNDCYKICLKPAIEQFGALLIDQCEVLKLKADRQRVTGIVCQWLGRRMTLEAPIVVLAAGALKTPAILLNSASPMWPDGLANDSGLVGKNLMRHLIDLYVVFPKTAGQHSPMKELAFNDLYSVDGEKFGSVQTFGSMPPAEIITADLEQQFADSSLPFAPSIFHRLRPIINSALTRFFTGKTILASILEDLPYSDNQVRIVNSPAADQPRLSFRYRLTEYDRQRIKRFREQVRIALKPYRAFLIKQAENNERMAHACGTCRFGTDPAASVLDPMNRAHALTNLYVVDSSFFPSSGGINPALTIAANALRVADHLIHEL
jgi:choline dehydrogenase-like flavoprotein